MIDEHSTTSFAENHPPMERWGSRTFLFLFHDVWFRLFVIGLLISAVFLSLFLPKIWVRTPPDFEPPLKASGLNLLQAWRLKRVAARHQAAGAVGQAIDAWTVAELNDPGDASIPRSALKTLLLETKTDRERLFYGYQRAIHLLRLSHTNSADLELVAQYFVSRNIHRYLDSFVPAGHTNLGPITAAAILATAFDRRDMAAFDALWKAHQAVLTTDAASRLRRAAWAIEWGPVGGVSTGRQELMEARSKPELRDLANQLFLAIHLQREDLAAYRTVLGELVDRHADRPRDHIGLWRLLYRSGAKAEAIDLAKRHTAPAADPDEAADYATALTQLGLMANSTEYLDRELPNFAFEIQLWRLQVRNLVLLKEWDELRQLAVLMRSSIHLHGQLEGYSAFLEGYAEAGADRSESAAPLFTKAVGESFGNADLAFESALAMRAVGHPGPALQLFNTLTNMAANEGDFWFQYTATAAAAKDAVATVIGAEKAYKIAPKNSAYAHNYATALLVNRQQPKRVLELSLARLQDQPNNPSAIINHTLALLLNGYHADVEKLLLAVSAGDLDADQNADLQLAWFEYYVVTKQYAQARIAYGRLELRRLFPIQAQWVRDTLAKFPSGA